MTLPPAATGVPGIYLAEVAQPQHRGAVGGGCQLAIMLGTLAEFGLGAVVTATVI